LEHIVTKAIQEPRDITEVFEEMRCFLKTKSHQHGAERTGQNSNNRILYGSIRYRSSRSALCYELGRIRKCVKKEGGASNGVMVPRTGFLLFASYSRQVSLYYIKVTTALPQYFTDHLAYIISTLPDSTFRTGRLNVRVHVFDVGSDSQVTVHIVHVLGGASGLCVRMLRGLMTLILTTTFLEPFGCVVTVSSP
jgi:hypothetical protein